MVNPVFNPVHQLEAILPIQVQHQVVLLLAAQICITIRIVLLPQEEYFLERTKFVQQRAQQQIQIFHTLT